MIRPFRQGGKALARLALPFDTYERHLLVARLVGPARDVLDVGGRPHRLSLFLDDAKVTTVNIDDPADLLYDGTTLPVSDGSYEAVTSIDTIEHLAPDERRLHLEELIRATRGVVVCCCPLGTPEHVEAEAGLARRHPHRFLHEHGSHGLPSEDELRGLAAGLPLRFELLFHGDFRHSAKLFSLGAEAKKLNPAAGLRYLGTRVRWRPDLRLESESGRFTNRVFLVGRS